jgi:hypothetical protein
MQNVRSCTGVDLLAVAQIGATNTTAALKLLWYELLLHHTHLGG